MKILGIDPGLRATGFGVIVVNGNCMNYVTSGVIRTDANQLDLPKRLGIIFHSLNELITEFEPDAAAIEQVFVNVNPQSTLLLGQARGAALCALVTHQLSVAEYTALQLKQAVVGNGRANKKQVQEMVKHLLHLPSAPQADAADALGIAICHAQNRQLLSLLHAKKSVLTLKSTRIRHGRLIS